MAPSRNAPSTPPIGAHARRDGRRNTGIGYVDPMDAPPNRFGSARKSLSRHSSSTLSSLRKQSSSARERLVRTSSSASQTLRRRSSHALQYLKKQLRRDSGEPAPADPDTAERMRPLEERGRRKRMPAHRVTHHARSRRFTGQELSTYYAGAAAADDMLSGGSEAWAPDPLRRSLSSRSVGSRSVGSRSVGGASAAAEQGRSAPAFRVSEQAVMSRHAKSLGVRTERVSRHSEVLDEDEDEEDETHLEAMRAYLAKRDARKSLYV